MKSNWDLLKIRSQYHFDTDKWNPKWDRVEKVGCIAANWQQELETVLAEAKSITWRTRGRNNDPLKRQDIEYDQEEYDLEQQGYGKDFIISDLTYSLPDVFQEHADKFCLEKCMARVHVQRPGQVWNLHLDKLEKWMPEDPNQVVRYFIQLTDWQQGHFWSFGNYTWWGWHAGDIVTFDWLNVPHSTANAGHTARATLQITGIKTAETDEYLKTLSHK
jgi:hypothetical protein